MNNMVIEDGSKLVQYRKNSSEKKLLLFNWFEDVIEV